MHGQPPIQGVPTQSSTWDDEIDIRELIETLLQRKWLIVSVVVVAMLAAGIYSFFVATPKYESTVVVAIPSATTADSMGMTLQAFESLAVSNGVLQDMIRTGNLQMEAHRVQGRLHVRLDTNARILQMTAHGPSAEEAHRLAQLWLSVYQERVVAYAQSYVGERLHAAEENLRTAAESLLIRMQALHAFEQEYSVEAKEARLARWEAELTAAETRLEELIQRSIPVDTGRVAMLEEMLAALDPTLAADDSLVVALSSVGEFAGTGLSVINPLYIDVSKDLHQTRTRLESNRLMADLLEERLEQLPIDVDNLQAELVELRAEHRSLDDEAKTAKRLHDDAVKRFEESSSTHSRLASFARIAVVAEPMIPSGPVAPRKMLNIALAAVLGGFVGVGLAFFQHFWDNSPRARQSGA